MTAHPDNQLFHGLRKIADAQRLPTWSDYEAGDDAARADIERRWKSNWRSKEACDLLDKAHSLKNAAHEKQNVVRFEARVKAAPKLYGPPGGYRRIGEDRQNEQWDVDPSGLEGLTNAELGSGESYDVFKANSRREDDR